MEYHIGPDAVMDAETLIEANEIRKDPERLKAAIKAMRDQLMVIDTLAKALELDSLLDAKE